MNTLTNPVFVGKTAFPLHAKTNHFLGALPVPFMAQKSPVTVFDGPPYANGLPHLGHMLNKHLKDTLARSLSLNHFVHFRPGSDCHGLPVELASLKENPDNPLYRSFARRQLQKQQEVFKEQGFMMQWDNPWSTMDFSFEAHTLACFQTMLEKDHVKVNMQGTPWCGLCGSTLAQAEQEDMEHKSSQYLVSFRLQDGTHMLVWTTTLWSVPFHQHLLLHPSSTFKAMMYQNNTYWVSADTFDHWLHTLNATDLEQTVKAQELQGVSYTHAFGCGTVKLEEHVLPFAGTGALHCVPGLSELDSMLGEKHNWELCLALNEQGVVTHSPCLEQVGHVFWSREVLSLLKQQLPVVWEDLYKQETPHCWRHKTPVFFRPSRQVYLDLSSVTDRVYSFVEETSFVPSSSKARMKSFLKDRTLWCVSRQRKWGVPLCLLVDQYGNLLKEESLHLMEKAKAYLSEGGVEHWRAVQHDFVPEGTTLVDDVLDVWFDSGCVPSFLGTDGVACEGSDQHRGWFQSCMWVNALLGKDKPFSMVLTHGFVVDHKGEKLAKSKGEKQKSWREENTDVVRLWALGGAVGTDRKWDKDTVDQAKQRLHKYRNSVRFLLANMPQNPLSEDCVLDPDDAYFVWQTQYHVHECVMLMQQGAFHDALTKMEQFLDVLSKVAFHGWKDRLYCAYPNTPSRQSVEKAVYDVYSSLMVFVSVVCPRLFNEAQTCGPFLDVEQKWQRVQDNGQTQQDDLLWMQDVVLQKERVNDLVLQHHFPKNVSCLVVPHNFGMDLRRLADYWDVGEVCVEEGVEMHVKECSHTVCLRCRRPGTFVMQQEWCDTCEERQQEA